MRTGLRARLATLGEGIRQLAQNGAETAALARRASLARRAAQLGQQAAEAAVLQALGDAPRRHRRDHRHEFGEYARVYAGSRGDMLDNLFDAIGTAENLAQQVTAGAGRFGRMGDGRIGKGRDMGGIGQMAEDLGQALGALQMVLKALREGRRKRRDR